jgi:hypothetical protein
MAFAMITSRLAPIAGFALAIASCGHREPPRPGAAAAPADATTAKTPALVEVELVLDTGDDVRFVGVASQFDGVRIPDDNARLDLGAGMHELVVKLAVAPRQSGAGGEPIQFEVRQFLVLPPDLVGQKSLRGGTRVKVSDRRSGSLAERLSVSSEAISFARPQPLPRAVMLAPDEGGGRLTSDVGRPPHKPTFPRLLEARPGLRFWALYKVCVDEQSAVRYITTMKPASESGEIDLRWKTAIRTWRYTPHQVDGSAVPFCYPARFEYQSTGAID